MRSTRILLTTCLVLIMAAMAFGTDFSSFIDTDPGAPTPGADSKGAWLQQDKNRYGPYEAVWYLDDFGYTGDINNTGNSSINHWTVYSYGAFDGDHFSGTDTTPNVSDQWSKVYKDLAGPNETSGAININDYYVTLYMNMKTDNQTAGSDENARAEISMGYEGPSPANYRDPLPRIISGLFSPTEIVSQGCDEVSTYPGEHLNPGYDVALPESSPGVPYFDSSSTYRTAGYTIGVHPSDANVVVMENFYEDPANQDKYLYEPGTRSSYGTYNPDTEESEDFTDGGLIEDTSTGLPVYTSTSDPAIRELRTIGVLDRHAGAFDGCYVDSIMVTVMDRAALTGDMGGDLNYDGFVNAPDLTRLLANYGMWPNSPNIEKTEGLASRWDGDTNEDNLVNAPDLTKLLATYGNVYSGLTLESEPTTAPEPASLAIIALGSLLALRRRRNA